MPNPILVFDAESDGLLGPVFTSGHAREVAMEGHRKVEEDLAQDRATEALKQAGRRRCGRSLHAMNER